MPLLVGVGALRTDHAEQLARDAEEAGADALLLAPVSYIPLTQEEVYRHFTAVAAATGLPLVIYNNPTATKFTFGIKLIEKLAEVPTIARSKCPCQTASRSRLRLQTCGLWCQRIFPLAIAEIGARKMRCWPVRMPGIVSQQACCPNLLWRLQRQHDPEIKPKHRD